MKFCSKCGRILIPIEKEGSIVLRCDKCGFETREAGRTLSKMKRDKEKVVVIEREAQQLRTLPTVRAECPKCGYNEACYWIVQTRGIDESSTQFFRCVKCNYTWRELS